MESTHVKHCVSIHVITTSNCTGEVLPTDTIIDLQRDSFSPVGF